MNLQGDFIEKCPHVGFGEGQVERKADLGQPRHGARQPVDVGEQRPLLGSVRAAAELGYPPAPPPDELMQRPPRGLGVPAFGPVGARRC